MIQIPTGLLLKFSMLILWDSKYPRIAKTIQGGVICPTVYQDLL